MVTMNDVIQKYLEIRNHKTLVTKKHKEEMEKIDKALEAIEGYMMGELVRLNVKSVRCDSGTSYQKRTMHVKTLDADQLFDFVKEKNKFDLLTAAVSKDATKEFMGLDGLDIDGMSIEDLNKLVADKAPPGVQVSFSLGVNVRKAS